MRYAVLDASVVLNWLPRPRGRTIAEATTLRREFIAGELVVSAPPLLRLEVLNVAGRQWRRTNVQLQELVAVLDDLDIDYVEPDLGEVAAWVGRGLTAYDASYVALSEITGAPLVTDDREILDLAGDLAIPLRSG